MTETEDIERSLLDMAELIVRIATKALNKLDEKLDNDELSTQELIALLKMQEAKTAMR